MEEEADKGWLMIRIGVSDLLAVSCHLLYLCPHGVVAIGILFFNRSFFLSFLSPKDLRDGSTDRQPL